MRKQRKTIEFITGLSADDIRKMTRAELLWYAKFATDTANKRRERALGSLRPDEPVPRAYQDWRSKRYNHKTATGEKATSFRDVDFTMSPDMSFRELKSKFMLINKFLKTTTSTKTGYEKFMKGFRRSLREKIAKEEGIDISKVKLRRLTRAETDDLWKAYNRVIESNPTIIGYSSTQVQAMLYQAVSDKDNMYDVDDLVEMAEEYAKDIKTKRERKERIDYDIPDSPLELGKNGKGKSTGRTGKSSKRNRR